MAGSSDIVIWIPRLRRYARALTGDPAAADDLLQDTLTRAMEKFSLWREGSDLRAWLFTIMHNLFVNGLRNRPMTVPLDEGESLPGHRTAPDDSTVNDLVKCLAQLPNEQREIILLVALEDMSYKEAAQVLSIPIGTVMSRLSRGRERLGQLMWGGAARDEAGEVELRVVK